MLDTDGLATFLGYKAWANELLFAVLEATPVSVVEARQKIVFGSIVRTLHHNCAIDEVWRAHLNGEAHGYDTRSPESCPALQDIASAQSTIDQWFVQYVDGLSRAQVAEVVSFTVIGGGSGQMSRLEILMHVVNHATYHRGHVAAMLYDAGIAPPTTDLPVYIRSVRQ